MNQARNNPIAQAASRGEQIVMTADIGDGYGFVGFRLQAATNAEGDLCAFLMAVGGRNSSIAGLIPATVPVCELGRISIADLKAKFAQALDPKPEEPTLVVA